MTTKIFSTILTGDQEVPPSGSTAIGLGVVLWDEAADTATYRILVKAVDFGDAAAGRDAQTAFVGDDVVNMHVHNAPPGVNGPIVFGQIGPAQDTDDLRIALNADGSWTVRGAWEPTDPASTSIESFAALLDAAEPGSEVPLYFNIHTRDFPGGEIRGQWVALGAVDHGVDGGSDAPLRLSLDADTASSLFDSFLRFLARDARSDRDPSREAGGLNVLTALTDLVTAGWHDDHYVGHGTQAGSWWSV